jgi:hypothetical protein
VVKLRQSRTGERSYEVFSMHFPEGAKSAISCSGSAEQESAADQIVKSCSTLKIVAK